MPHERVQRALDGELPVDQLDPAELALYHRFRSALATALEPVGRIPEVDVVPAVLRRISAPARPSAPERLATWLWKPRPVSLTFRPAFGLAAAAAALLLWVAVPAGRAAPAVAVTDSAPPVRVLVQFRLSAAEAEQVALVGDFNGWEPRHAMHRIAPDVWSVSVALEPGVYDYGFVVDGTTLSLDPLAPRVSDGFGGESSRVAVLAPEVRS